MRKSYFLKKIYYCFIMICMIYPINTIGQISFTSSILQNATISNPTCLQFGPDGKLYAAQQDGTIKIFSVTKTGPNNYSVTNSETILLVKHIPNHYDDGTTKPFNIFTNKRQITGLFVAGTSSNPIIYVSSSDSDIGAGSNGDKNLCTNSGIISKLIKNEGEWIKTDLVRGLPRSEENHATNGLVYDAEKNYLYACSAGMTNAGSPSKLFAYITEYALSAAVLAIDLNYIESLPLKTDPTGIHPYKYDLPTLDDPTRSNTPEGNDVNDPWGGNDGLNQAKLIEGGPVKIVATGFRNPYDIVFTKTTGKKNNLYLIDNGANQNWGGHPDQEGTPNVTNNYVPGEPGSSGAGPNDPMVNNLDGLHYIGNTDTYIFNSYYGGHPCPIRANPSGAGLYTHEGTLSDGVGVFRTTIADPTFPLPSDWPPVPLSLAHPIEGNFQNPGENNPALLTYKTSTNGLCEYTASNFGGVLKGDLITVGLDGHLHRIKLSADGTEVLNTKGSKKINMDASLASGFGNKPLDVTSLGDNAPFPGTIWTVQYASNTIAVFEPEDGVTCAGEDNNLDEDNDGYTNADEIDNGTNPCSAASRPEDLDQDLISDLNDTDDDNDEISDNNDFFQIDSLNGLNSHLPLSLSLFNNDPGHGFFGMGFTGLMNNGTDYRNQYDESNLIAGGAIGALTIVNVPEGDALGNLNDQDYGFQLGINVNAGTPPFYIHGVMLGNFFNNQTPVDFQSQGIYLGRGDQNNYLKIVLNANGGQGGIEVVLENEGTTSKWQHNISSIPFNSADFYLHVIPSKAAVVARYSLDGGEMQTAGDTTFLTGTLKNTLQGNDALAVGIISTSRGSNTFNTTWDLIEMNYENASSGDWQPLASSDGVLPAHRHENAYVQCGNKFYLIGGRGSKPTGIYDPLTKKWTKGASTPIWLHHFQAVEMDGLIYAAGALTGNYPAEPPVPVIYIYDPKFDKWFTGDSIPEERRRGSSGAVVYNKKIYLIGGITNGHNSGYVSWFDEYDPLTGTWRILPDAPHSRDHFHAAIKDNMLYLAGGRQTSASTGHLFDQTVEETDVFDFSTNTWTTLSQPIPTPRGGATVAIIDNKLLVMGGESPQLIAHNETEGLDLTSMEWKSYDKLNKGRHGTQAVVNNEVIYLTAGSGVRGSGEELNTQELFSFGEPEDPILTPVIKSDLEVVETINFGIVEPGESRTENIVLENINGNQTVWISDIILGNNNENVFHFTINEELPIALFPGSSKELSVTYEPVNRSSHQSSLILKSNAAFQTITISLTGGEPAPVTILKKPVFLINTGGPSYLQDTLQWQTDSQEEPSAYSNHTQTFNKANTITYYGTNTTDAPDYLFNYYRWDPGVLGDPVSKEMRWTFPLENGQYEVNLYFSETYPPAGSEGQRVFDVHAEEQIVLDNYDIYMDAGFNNAIKKSFNIDVNDGNLNLDFIHIVQNPLVYGIAIYSIDSIPTVPQDENLVVKLIKPTSASRFNSPASIPLEAVIETGQNTDTYLKVDCSDGGWRKLKLGYNFSNLWNPKHNVTEGGNTTLEIVIKDLNGNANWNKLSIRPQGNSQSPVMLGNYISSAEQLNNSWMLLKIPISDFPSGIDFTNLSLIEIPYSAGAGAFSIGIKKITFTGGSVPFLWFGETKTDNYHDGQGGGGQLTAELQTGSSSDPIEISKVEFYANENLLFTDHESPYQYNWDSVYKGDYELSAIAYTNVSTKSESEKIEIIVDSITGETSFQVIVHFDSIPENYQVKNSKLKYNKDFVFSFTLDDGKIDGLTNVYTLFNGGTIAGNGTTYNGLFYTDGCGNDIPFRAGLAWNSANGTGNDVHTSTPGYLTWDNLKFLYNQKWDVFNHSFTHAAGSGTDYQYQITENTNKVKEKTGIDLTHFVIPSGDEMYTGPAFSLGMKAVYDQGGNLPGVNGLNVSNLLNYSNFALNRHFIHDNNTDTTNATAKIDQVADKSINGNHYWYNEFTHRIDFSSTGGGLLFPTFENYMNHIEKEYGKSGNDNIWMAPLQEVYEYLYIRDNITYTATLDSNKLMINFDLSAIPEDLSKNVLTLLIESETTFSHIEVLGVTHYTFKGTGDTKIINLEWESSPVELTFSQTEEVVAENIVYRINAGEEENKHGWESDKLYLKGMAESYKGNQLPAKPFDNYPITDSIFQTARTTYSDNKLLQWEFLIEKGGEVEVRLYFTELLIDSLETENFNIQLEDSTHSVKSKKQSNKKRNTASVKTLKTISDGSVNLNILKIKQNPLINGIEIICLNDRCNRNNIQFHSVVKEGKYTAFPNPAQDVLNVSSNDPEEKETIIRILDSQGMLVETIILNINEETVDMSVFPVGIYFLEITSQNGKWNETIRLVKK